MTNTKSQSFLLFEKERIVTFINFIKGINAQNTTKEISIFSLATQSFKEMNPQCKSIFYMYLFTGTFSAIIEGLIPITSMYVYNSLPPLASGLQSAILLFALFFSIHKFRDILGELFLSQTNYYNFKFMEKFSTTSDIKSYIDIANKPRAFFTINNPATLSLTAKRGNAAKSVILRDCVNLIRNFITVIISLFSLAYISITFVGIFLFISLLYIEMYAYFQSIKRLIVQKNEIIGSHIHKNNRDVLQNAPLIQDALSKEREHKFITNRNNKLFSIKIKEYYLRYRNEFALRIISDLIFSVMVGIYAIYDIIETGDIGRFTLIATATNSVRIKFREYALVYSFLLNGRNTYVDANKLLLTPKALERKTGDKKLTNKDNIIYIKDIRFSYPKIKDITLFGSEKETIERGNEVIKGITTTIKPGKITVIAGTSGEGKTTLMNLIRHDYDLIEGSIKLGTKDLTSLCDEEINKQIAFIDQNVHFFDQTLIYNLKYFKENATDEELKKALEASGLIDDIAKLKDGMYHRIGQDGRAISGGQRQRLALARIFLTDRPIMIFDEPTTGLDQVLSFRIMKTLKEKALDKTILLVTHNPTEIALADRIIVIKNGQIESDGTPLQLIETSAFLKSCLTRQDILSKQKLFDKI